MFIPILFGSDSVSDSGILNQIKNHFIATHPTQSVFNLPWQRMLDGYRNMKAQGKSDTDVVLYWTSTGMKRDDAGTFVSAMKILNKGQAIQDPFTKPSIEEIASGYATGLGKVASGITSITSKLPWGILIAAGVGYILVNQAAKKYI